LFHIILTIMLIEINNQTSFVIPAPKVISLLKFAAEKLAVKKGLNVSVAFVSEKRIKELNRRYRGKNNSADVLSFRLNQLEAEIIICPAKAKKQAKDAEYSLQKEILILVLHGFLHILGFDHERSLAKAREMEKVERAIIGKFKSVW